MAIIIPTYTVLVTVKLQRDYLFRPISKSQSPTQLLLVLANGIKPACFNVHVCLFRNHF